MAPLAWWSRAVIGGTYAAGGCAHGKATEMLGTVMTSAGSKPSPRNWAGVENP